VTCGTAVVRCIIVHGWHELEKGGLTRGLDALGFARLAAGPAWIEHGRLFACGCPLPAARCPVLGAGCICPSFPAPAPIRHVISIHLGATFTFTFILLNLHLSVLTPRRHSFLLLSNSFTTAVTFIRSLIAVFELRIDSANTLSCAFRPITNLFSPFACSIEPEHEPLLLLSLPHYNHSRCTAHILCANRALLLLLRSRTLLRLRPPPRAAVCSVVPTLVRETTAWYTSPSDGELGHAFRKGTAGAFGPDLAKKLSQLVKMEKNVMRSMELVARERMEVAVSPG